MPKVANMPQTNSMHTSFDCLLDGAEPKLDDDRWTGRVGGACFAAARDVLRKSGKFNNKYMNQLKYYPWVREYKDFDMKKWTEQWLKVALSVPFIKRRVIEYTGYDYDALYPVEGEDYAKECGSTVLNKDKYFLIDFTVPVDEPFVVCSILRTPQEFPDQIVTFSKILEETGNELLAFVCSLYYGRHGTPRTGGHQVCNGLDTNFWWNFLRDPSIAVSKANAWKSNVLGGKGYSGLSVTDFCKAVTVEDPPVHDVIVYGSLRQGLGNHGLLKRGLDKGEAIHVLTAGDRINAVMYDTGSGFPALVPDVNAREIKFEQYKVNDKVFADLDRLEGYPAFYDRKQVLFHGTPCWVYFQRESRAGYKPVEFDWVMYKRKTA